MKQNFSIFVINLPVDVKRREAIEGRLKELGAHYEIAFGIYGDDPRVLERYDEARAIKEHGKPLVFGEKGCALAHALVHERIVRESIPYSLILEDDMLLPDNFIGIVEKEIARRKNWDWLSFDYRYVGMQFLYHWWIATIKTVQQKPLFIFYALIKAPYMILLSVFEGTRNFSARTFPLFAGAKHFYRPLYNAGAYILTRDGAEKLLSFETPLRLTADQLPNVARWKSNFIMRGYAPLIVKQNLKEYGSQAAKSEDEFKAENTR